MNATKNSFVLIDLRAGQDAAAFNKAFINVKREALVRLLCRGSLGVVADGCMFLELAQPPVDFKWDFYNSDGSVAEMCGNAARCVARFVFDRQTEKKPDLIFQTLAGQVKAKALADNTIEVNMPKYSIVNSNYVLSFGDSHQRIVFINTGVPHAVINRDNLDRNSLRDLAKKIRHHSYFGTSGANVTFWKKADANQIEALTFERGVEDFTWSCGTGAVAAVVDAFHHHNMNSRLSVVVPGGKLRVMLQPPNQAMLTGDAQYNFAFEIYATNEGLK